MLTLEIWQAEQAAALATKLKSMPDIDGSSILDNTAMLVLTDMGDAAPLGNMYVSLLRALGVDTTTFGVDGVAPLDGVNV